METQTPDMPVARPPIRAGAPKGRVVALWTLLLLIVIGTAILQSMSQSTIQEQTPVGDTLPPVPIQIQLMARYTLGAGNIVDVLGETAGAVGQSEMLLDQAMGGQIHQPLDRLRIVPLIAEISGAEEALTELDEIAALPDFPQQAQADLADMQTLYAPNSPGLSEDRQAAMKERHGWMGELALVYGKDDTDATRKAVLAEARNVFLAVFGVGIAMFCIGGLSFLLMMIVVIRWTMGKPPKWRYRKSEAPPLKHLAFLETMVLFLGAFIVLPLTAQALDLDLGIFTLIPLLLTPLWLLVRGISPAMMTAEMGWHRGEGIVKEAFMGVFGYLTCLPFLGVGMVLTAILIQFSDSQPVHPIVFELDNGIGGLVGPFLMACIAAPLLEETIFRGIFYNYLRRHVSMVGTGLITGVIFAAVHPQGWAAIPALASIGFSFAVLREWRGSLIGPMAAHFANNFTVLCIGYVLFG